MPAAKKLTKLAKIGLSHNDRAKAMAAKGMYTEALSELKIALFSLRSENKDGTLNMVTGIPEGFVVFRDGKQVPIEALAGGDKITAYIVHKETKVVTDQDIKVGGHAPVEAAPKPAPVAAPAPAPEPAPVLPKTGSNLPLAGLTGLVSLILGLGIAVFRR